jgi:hypothetical protein
VLSSLIAGLPDRMFLGHGLVIFVEFKRPGQKPRKRQEFVHRLFERLGHKVHIVDSSEQLVDILTAKIPEGVE